MTSLFKKFFTSESPEKVANTKLNHSNGSMGSPPPDGVPEPIRPVLTDDAVDFLLALLDVHEVNMDLQGLSIKDRAFVANNIRKVRQNSFEIPMLPQAAIRTQQLLSNSNVEAADFIEVIKGDQTLSVELLRMANSAYLGYTYPTLDLQQAIIRIGFGQLHGLVTMLSLRSRILHGTYFKNEVSWVMELSLAMAKLCQQLAPDLEMPPGEAFTLGLLHHIEYLVILGEASQISAANPGSMVSRTAIIDTVCRLGPTLHELIEKSWGFGSEKWVKLNLNSEGERNFESSDANELEKRLDTLQRMIIRALGGDHQLTDTAGFDARTIKSAIALAVLPPPKQGTGR